MVGMNVNIQSASSIASLGTVDTIQSQGVSSPQLRAMDEMAMSLTTPGNADLTNDLLPKLEGANLAGNAQFAEGVGQLGAANSYFSACDQANAEGASLSGMKDMLGSAMPEQPALRPDAVAKPAANEAANASQMMERCLESCFGEKMAVPEKNAIVEFYSKGAAPEMSQANTMTSPLEKMVQSANLAKGNNTMAMPEGRTQAQQPAAFANEAAKNPLQQRLAQLKNNTANMRAEQPASRSVFDAGKQQTARAEAPIPQRNAMPNAPKVPTSAPAAKSPVAMAEESMRQFSAKDSQNTVDVRRDHVEQRFVYEEVAPEGMLGAEAHRGPSSVLAQYLQQADSSASQATAYSPEALYNEAMNMTAGLSLDGMIQDGVPVGSFAEALAGVNPAVVGEAGAPKQIISPMDLVGSTAMSTNMANLEDIVNADLMNKFISGFTMQ